MSCFVFSICFLHTRGGVSLLLDLDGDFLRFSPHTWRCFPVQEHILQPRQVFSTHVEVFLRLNVFLLLLMSFLHTRGGVSYLLAFRTAIRKFSPHTWRCFQPTPLTAYPAPVFSTHVEVFLFDSSSRLLYRRFLHTRGGVSRCGTLLLVTG